MAGPNTRGETGRCTAVLSAKYRGGDRDVYGGAKCQIQGEETVSVMVVPSAKYRSNRLRFMAMLRTS